MPEPERDTQLPREAAPVTVTAANRAPDGPESIQDPPRPSDGHSEARDGDFVWHVLSACQDEEGCPIHGRPIETAEVVGTCDWCGQPFMTQEQQQRHDCPDAPESMSPACLRPDSCHPGDPCSPCLASSGGRPVYRDPEGRKCTGCSGIHEVGICDCHEGIPERIERLRTELDETRKDLRHLEDEIAECKVLEYEATIERAKQCVRHGADMSPEDRAYLLAALEGAPQPSAGPKCTATLTAHGKTHHCALPAGHYDETREPTWPDEGLAVDPGGWHSISARPSEDAQIWADRAVGATPHQEQQ